MSQDNNTPRENAHDDKEFAYNTSLPTGSRTVDRAEPRELTAEHGRALDALQRIVNTVTDAGVAESSPMAAPHVGSRMSQRQTARKVLAGRSYQAVQSWLKGEPMPAGMVDWMLNDLQRVDAGESDRMVGVGADEIAVIVKR